MRQVPIRAVLAGHKHVLLLGLSVLVGVALVCILLVALALWMHPQRSAEWVAFSIGPAAGRSLWIGPGAMRGDGMTVKAALATAYDIPAVRIIAPAWVGNTRYSINAEVDVDAPDRLRPLLQQELNARLHLKTHVEVRPFDVFVLTATDAPRLERAGGKSLRVSIHEWDAQLENAPLAALASSLQSVLGTPVIDETAITGLYNMQYRWTENRVGSVTATLHDRFGLRLSPAKREMQALIVEDIRRDAALVLLDTIGRLTRWAPSHVRQRIAQILTVD